MRQVGLYEAEMSSDSLQIAGMADRGILPKVLGLRSQYGTPVYGILMSSLCVILLSGFDFSNIVQMLNLLFIFGQAIEFAAFLHLRWYRMDIVRPYIIPLGFVGCVLMLIPTFIFMGIIMYFCSLDALGLCVFITAVGVGLYYVLEYAKSRKLAEFEAAYIESSGDDALDSRGLTKDGFEYKMLSSREDELVE